MGTGAFLQHGKCLCCHWYHARSRSSIKKETASCRGRHRDRAAVQLPRLREAPGRGVIRGRRAPSGGRRRGAAGTARPSAARPVAAWWCPHRGRSITRRHPRGSGGVAEPRGARRLTLHRHLSLGSAARILLLISASHFLLPCLSATAIQDVLSHQGIFANLVHIKLNEA